MSVDEVEQLIEELKDGDKDKRAFAAYLLGKYRDFRAVEPLIKALNDECWYVRRDVAIALGKIGDKRAVEPLIRLYILEQNEAVQGFVKNALYKLGGEPAIQRAKTLRRLGGVSCL